MSNKNHNIYDIAKAAGVSIATVSRVLSGSAKVRPETQKKVLDVIDRTNYTPNAFAQGLGLGTMKMVGILCTDVSDLYYAKAISALERLLRQEGLDTLLYCTGVELPDKKRFLDALLAKHVDAIILVGSIFQEEDNTHIEDAARRVPVVIINGQVDCPNTYCVLCDEFKAMRENVRLMKEKGLTRLLYLYHAHTYSSAQKLAGYRKGLEDQGIEPSAQREFYCERSVASSFGAVATFLEKGGIVDGIIASEDMLAVGAGKAFARAGMSVPVIGFDNSILAESATPSITSVDNMVERLCASAVQMLRDVLAGNPASPRLILDAVLVQRETFVL